MKKTRGKASLKECSTLNKMINDAKNQLRAKYKAVRRSLPNRVKARESKKITDKILNLDEYKASKNIFVYVSCEDEVDTHMLIEQMLRDKKTVLVPKCDTASNTMIAIKINDFSDLEVGAYGLLEPTDNKAFDKNNIDMIIVPGVAFDKMRNRLGLGGGYYDRFLNGFSGITVGVAFAECISDGLPTACTDVKMNIVISETREI